MGGSSCGREVECLGGPLDGEKKPVVGMGGQPLADGDRFAFPVSHWDKDARRTIEVKHVYRYESDRLHHEGPQA